MFGCDLSRCWARVNRATQFVQTSPAGCGDVRFALTNFCRSSGSSEKVTREASVRPHRRQSSDNDWVVCSFVTTASDIATKMVEVRWGCQQARGTDFSLCSLSKVEMEATQTVKLVLLVKSGDWDNTDWSLCHAHFRNLHRLSTADNLRFQTSELARKGTKNYEEAKCVYPTGCDPYGHCCCCCW